MLTLASLLLSPVYLRVPQKTHYTQQQNLPTALLSSAKDGLQYTCMDKEKCVFQVMEPLIISLLQAPENILNLTP